MALGTSRIRARIGAVQQRWLVAAAIFVVSAALYGAVAGERATRPSPNNHFVHLAQSYLDGQLHVVGNKPPGNNDWAKYGDRWYVSFPPLPAVLILPVVAIWGTRVWDPLFWALFAGLVPALWFLLLRRLSDEEQSERSLGEDLALTGLFAFGSVFFFVAVQGSVWFAAHVVATVLLLLYLWFGLNARRPLLAGLMLGLLLATRPATCLAVSFFVVEALRTFRRADALADDPDAWVGRRVARFVAGVDWARTIRTGLVFAVPVLLVGGVLMWANYARFDNPFEFGHSYLQIGWRARIERWGLFNYHYLSKNLAIFTASLPWLTATAPYLRISRHGLALWFTTPNLLWTLWPKRGDARMVALYLPVVLVGILDLCYQNSGWVQFGYRFSLDYLPFLFVALALGRRRFGPGFYLCMVFAVAVNLFGALTFDRSYQYYDNDRTQRRVFQPD